jgi:hypothetical protein
LSYDQPQQSGDASMEPIERDLIVSLGTNCEIAYNLRAFYGINRTGLFDWLITPPSCLPSLIRSRFKLVDDDFRDALVRVDLTRTNDSVMHAPTGILLHHAFTRDESDRISPNWRSEIDAVAEKFRFLGDRMNLWISEARYPAMFINKNGWHAAASQKVVEISHADDIYIKIIAAFRDAYPASDPLFCLLSGHDPSTGCVRGRPDVRAVSVANLGDWHEGIEGHYGGCKTGWREALDSLHLQVSAGGSSAAPAQRSNLLAWMTSKRLQLRMPLWRWERRRSARLS